MQERGPVHMSEYQFQAYMRKLQFKHHRFTEYDCEYDDDYNDILFDADDDIAYCWQYTIAQVCDAELACISL